MPPQTPNDPVILGLAALAATLGDERRARRFLDLTGIETAALRERADDPVILAALIAFLEAHEPDFTAVSEQMGVSPAALSAARAQLESQE